MSLAPHEHVQAAVIGTGSWGTAFAAVLADAGGTVRMWGRRPEAVAQINAGRNQQYLPDLALPDSISATVDLEQALAGASLVVLAVPSQSLRENLTAWGACFHDARAVVSLMKGIELVTAKRMSEVIVEVGGIMPERVAVVSGPNLAHEIAAQEPAGAVVASIDDHTSQFVADACSAPYFRPYTGRDVIGVEIAGSVKNVIALAVGMADGLGYGDNSRASLITRGLAEATRIGVAAGGDAATFAGLAGVGDLVATCTSPLSRNHSFGTHLGRGLSVTEVTALTQQTAEGVKSCAAIRDLAHTYGVEVPIIEQVHQVISEGKHPRELVSSLLARSRRPKRE